METLQTEETKLFSYTLNPLTVAYRIFLITLISIIIGLIIPAFVAYYGGVFYKDGVKVKLPDQQRKMFKNYELSLKQLEIRSEEIDSLIQSNKQQKSQSPNIILFRNQYYKELQELKPPFQLSPFYLNSIMLVWVIMYIALGCLIQLLQPGPQGFYYLLKKFSYTIKIAAGIYLIYQWPVWMRNFVLSNEGRVVYSFANYDIFPGSFFMQEINTIIFAIMLSILWQQWSNYYMKLSFKQKDLLPFEYKIAKLNNSDTKKLSLLFIHWQIMSVILALGFIVFTSAFWDLVVMNHDKRYVIPALAMHTLWGITWVLISLPLLTTWYSWQATRAGVLIDIINDHSYESDKANTFIKIITEVKPIGVWNIASSGLAALISFALPIIQAFY